MKKIWMVKRSHDGQPKFWTSKAKAIQCAKNDIFLRGETVTREKTDRLIAFVYSHEAAYFISVEYVN